MYEAMKDIFTPLTAKEMDQLDDFLLTRVDDSVDEANKDEGVICLSGLDGYFTAIVSGPVACLPSQWILGLWGDFEPEGMSKAEFEVVFLLFIRHMNTIANVLLEQPQNYQPIFLEHEVGSEIYTIVDEWCEGYMRGLLLNAEYWHLDEPEMKALLAPIKAFIGGESLHIHASFSQQEIERIKNTVSSDVRKIYAYWLVHIEEFPEQLSFLQDGFNALPEDPHTDCSGSKERDAIYIE